MMQKRQWTTPIIAILLGACIGLSILLIQERQQLADTSYASSVKKAAPSVVNIYTHTSTPKNIINKDSKTHTTNLGSGVIITKSGYILTNYHVVQNAQQIVVSLGDDRQTDAILIGSDPATDLAVLKIHLSNLTPIELGDSKKVQVGDKILAIGNPFGIGQTVTAGIISAKGRNSIGLNTYENFLQTDAAINPGNSGGALVNLTGQLIGISSALYSSTGGSQGIGFATPIDDAMTIMSNLIKHGKVVRSYLGMDAKKVTKQLAKNLSLPVDYGLLVSNIVKQSPADKAGIEVGDIIIKVDRVPTTNPFETQKAIINKKPGSTISLVGIRGQQSYQTNIQLDKQPILQQAAN